jgi:protein phosphatase
VGPISLSTLYRETDITLDSLTAYSRSTIERTISASSLSDAERIVTQLAELSDY